MLPAPLRRSSTVLHARLGHEGLGCTTFCFRSSPEGSEPLNPPGTGWPPAQRQNQLKKSRSSAEACISGTTWFGPRRGTKYLVEPPGRGSEKGLDPGAPTTQGTQRDSKCARTRPCMHFHAPRGWERPGRSGESPGWSGVTRYVRIVEVAGSSPVTSTIITASLEPQLGLKVRPVSSSRGWRQVRPLGREVDLGAQHHAGRLHLGEAGIDLPLGRQWFKIKCYQEQ